jgi:hypothetical protein
MSLVLLPALYGAPEARETRLVSSRSSSIVFEIEVPAPTVVQASDGASRVLLPGYGTFSPPGAPELPGKTFHVAVPSSGTPRVTAVVLREEDLGAMQLARVPEERMRIGEDGYPISELHYPPDPWEAGFTPPLVSAGEASYMRRVRVLPVRVIPLRIDNGRVRIARRIAVTVRIEGAAEAPRIGEERIPGTAGAWDRLYKGILVNPGDVAAFGVPVRRDRTMRSRTEETNRLKIRIPDTGTYSVRADSLIARGLSPNLAINGSAPTFALKKFYYDASEPDLMREVDIPVHIVEGSSGVAGLFDEDDRVVFYAHGLRDDPDAGDQDALFTDDNVIWLEEQTAGAIMTEGDALPTNPTITVTKFRAVFREREDTYYERSMVMDSKDFYYLAPPVARYAQSIMPFELHEPQGSDAFSLSVEVKGTDDRLYRQRLDVYIGSRFVGRDSISYDDLSTITFSGIPSDWLTDGENELILTSDATYGFLVNEFSINYPARFIARDNMLEFSMGLVLGVVHVDITGFTVNSGVLIELTDPSNILYYELPSEMFGQNGGTYTLSLNLTAPHERRYVVVGAGAGTHVPNAAIEQDISSDLRELTGPYHTLIVTHGDFHPRNTGELSDYAEWRRGQGYRVLIADVQDAYDEFNGGLRSTVAIKRFARYGLERWGVEYVLLVGDGNQDHKQLFRYTPPDFIPPYTFGSQLYETVPPEVVASDKYYAFLDEGTSDTYPDVFVGRLPVGEVKELRALVLKLKKFEEAGAGDTWRRNVILFADDAWSGSSSDYSYKSSELEFERSMKRVAASIESSLPGGFDVKQPFISRWTEGLGPSGFTTVRDSTRRYFTPYLLRMLDEGCLVFTFQGHARRSVFTSEHAFASFRTYADLDSLRPSVGHIFIGLGCHISEFARASELSQHFDGPNGDCITEQLLFKPGTGSVGTYASTGFEFLLANAHLCETLHETIFEEPPADSVPPGMEYTGAHLVLGEAITKAEIERIGVGGFEQVYRYVLLGDPMTKIDTGPPLMRFEADWGGGWVEFAPDSLRAREGRNACALRCTASDVVAIGGIELEVDGVEWTDSLEITPLVDLDKTYARSYRAELDYTINLEHESLVFKVLKANSGEPAGIVEIPFETDVRLFYNDYLEIGPSVECPPSGTFKLTVDFPAYISQEPVLFLDGLPLDAAVFTVPDVEDSLHWETVFGYSFAAGPRKLTVRVGEFEKDFLFTVSGNELVLDAFNFPNPFREGTNFIYTLNLPADAGSIEIFNISGHSIKRIDIPRWNLDAASFDSPHTIYWDGRDMAGDRIANGTYIYLVRVEKGGSTQTLKGKCVKLE